MKVCEILAESTDISGFGKAVYKETILELDRYLRKQFQPILDKAYEQNPNDPADAAYTILKKRYPPDRMFSPKWLLRNQLQDHLNKTLRNYLQKQFGDDFSVGKERQLAHPKSFTFEFLNKLTGAVGQYNRRADPKYTNNIAIQIEVPLEKWEIVWSDWFVEFVSGNSTFQVIKEFLNSIMSVIIHEVTHAVNDIQGSTHQNTAYIKQGKAYGDASPSNHFQQLVDKVGTNILHLSRTSEIQTFASQIAWELAQSILTDSYWDNSPEHVVDELDYLIKDLAVGYHNSSTLEYHRELIDRVKTLTPKKIKHLDKIWKKLLGQIVRNLQKYKQHYESQSNT